jgi:hypothetical protein
VPAENSFRTWFGHIKLDLRQAQISATETHIHARALFGNVDLLVPEGVEVEVQARTQVGRTNLQASSGIPGAPRIVLTGGTFFGDIKVRHRRLWEKLGRPGRRTEEPAVRLCDRPPPEPEGSSRAGRGSAGEAHRAGPSAVHSAAPSRALRNFSTA